MAHVSKATRVACNNLFNHYERKDGIEFGNQEINTSKSHLNYNLFFSNQSQIEILNQRLSEVKVLKRKDVNVMCSWVITLPKNIEVDSLEEKLFFEKSFEFLKNKYGEKNVISSYVHKDEKTPHMHFCFVPVVLDKKNKIEKVSAKELLTRNHLQVFHKELSNYLYKYFKRDIGILNGSTVNGNKTVLELKNENLEKELKCLESHKEKINKEIECIEHCKTSLEFIEKIEIKERHLFSNSLIVSGVNKSQLEKIIKNSANKLIIKNKYKNLEDKYKALEKMYGEIIIDWEKLHKENKRLSLSYKSSNEFSMEIFSVIRKLQKEYNIPDDKIKTKTELEIENKRNSTKDEINLEDKEMNIKPLSLVDKIQEKKKIIQENKQKNKINYRQIENDYELER